MKKYFFLLSLLIVVSVSAQAQEAYSIRQLSDMVGQLEWNKASQKEVSLISGSPYLYDDFKAGDVYYDGKYKVEQIQLRFNLYNDEFEYRENTITKSFAKPQRIDKIVIGDEVFIYLKKSGSYKISGFVKMWNADFPTVLTKMTTEFLEKEEAKPYVVPKPDRFERKHDKHYVMKSDTEIEKIASVKKLIKYLGVHSAELTKYAKKERISASDGTELAMLIDYYHEL